MYDEYSYNTWPPWLSTGKTTRLLDIMENELKSGVAPNKLAFCSFTKKAVIEAQDRAIARFNFTKADLSHFRTIHSTAFASIGLSRDQVMQNRNYSELGKHLGLKFNTKYEVSDGPAPVGKNPGQYYMFLDGYAKTTGKSKKDVWEMFDHIGLNWFEFTRFCNTLEDYKMERNLYDYSDMLLHIPRALDIDVLIIDEAQDLSTSQWKFLWQIFKNVKRVYIGGDDDQAIFEWSGADVSYFMQLEGKKEILHQSYRVPKAVHSLATSLSTRITNRTTKPYMPQAIEGSVNYWRDIDTIDMSQGSWLLLCRNAYLLNELCAAVKAKGYNYALRGIPALPQSHIKAIQLYEAFRKGYVLSQAEKEVLAEFTDTLDITKIWHEAFHKWPLELREYYVSLLRSGEDVKKQPRINVTTIHGSKGGEADHVAILSDMAFNTWETTHLNTDAEHRVWYVGATRCKESLNIILPRGRYHYDL